MNCKRIIIDGKEHAMEVKKYFRAWVKMNLRPNEKHDSTIDFNNFLKHACDKSDYTTREWALVEDGERYFTNREDAETFVLKLIHNEFVEAGKSFWHFTANNGESLQMIRRAAFIINDDFLPKNFIENGGIAYSMIEHFSDGADTQFDVFTDYLAGGIEEVNIAVLANMNEVK